MKLVVLAAAAILALGGIGVGAYFYFMPSAQASAGANADAIAVAAKAEKDKAEAEAKEKTVEFINMDPLILPIIDKDGVSQVVSLVIALEIHDPLAKEEIAKLTPRLKDAYIQDMYGLLNSQSAMKGGVIQVSYIKKRLNEITIHVLGADVVQDVLLQVVQQRPA